VVIQRSQFVGELCVPDLSAGARVASAATEADEEEMQQLTEEMDAMIDVYLASDEADPPEQRLAVSWGSTLYAPRGEG
jgi:hypothetical protein